MQSKSEIRLLEVCNEDAKIKLPSRSELYNLEPIGLGTEMCESLASWISRLSAEYNVSNVVFLKTVLKDLVIEKNINYQLRNGMNPFTCEIVNILEMKTSRIDLSYLTTLPWQGSFSSNSMLRKNKFWCPDCFDNRRSQSLEVFEPLIWSLTLATFCPIHEKKLIDKCPSCERRLNLFHNNNKIGYCNYCEAWLGDSRNSEDMTCQSDFERFTLMQISELIKFAPQMSQFPIRNRTSFLFRKLLQDITEGNKKKLSRICGSDKRGSFLFSYLHRNLIPSLKTFMFISYNLNITIREMLFSNLETHQFSLQNLKPTQKIDERQNKKSINISLIEKHIDKILNSQLPLMKLKDLCNEYEVSYYLLRQCLGEKTKRLLQFSKLATQKRKDELMSQILLVTEDLYNKGIYPSYRQVINITGHYSLTLNSEIQIAYKQKLKQLGITQRVN
ncbi:MAG: TniQ family protein [Bacillota bacterium]